MKRILDTFSVAGRNKTYTFPIDRTVPQVGDVIEKLSYPDAIKAIELMCCEEELIRRHLRIGSTPPTKISVVNIPEEHRRIQTLVYNTFGVTYICD